MTIKIQRETTESPSQIGSKQTDQVSSETSAGRAPDILTLQIEEFPEVIVEETNEKNQENARTDQRSVGQLKREGAFKVPEEPTEQLIRPRILELAKVSLREKLENIFQIPSFANGEIAKVTLDVKRELVRILEEEARLQSSSIPVKRGSSEKAEKISLEKLAKSFRSEGLSEDAIANILKKVGKERGRTRPTFIKAHRRHLSPATLDTYGLPWEFDAINPNYVIVRQWLNESDTDILFEHTRELHKMWKRTYLKVHREHICPGTLDAYQLPWEWDERDPNYIIIMRWLPEDDQDILFDHTSRLRNHPRSLENSLISFSSDEAHQDDKKTKSERRDLTARKGVLPSSGDSQIPAVSNEANVLIETQPPSRDSVPIDDDDDAGRRIWAAEGEGPDDITNWICLHIKG